MDGRFNIGQVIPELYNLKKFQQKCQMTYSTVRGMS